VSEFASRLANIRIVASRLPNPSIPNRIGGKIMTIHAHPQIHIDGELIKSLIPL